MNRIIQIRSESLQHWLVLAVAASLPWSTSATGILISVWAVISIACLEWKSLPRALSAPAIALPLVICFMAIIGTAWSYAGPADRWNGLVSFLRLLAFPLLAVQYARFGRGKEVLLAFLTSCTLLLLISFVLDQWPTLPQKSPGVLVKDYIVQSIEFAVCGMILVDRVITSWHLNRPHRAALLSALAAAFFASIFFVASGRTTFVIVGVLVILCGWRHGDFKGAIIASILGVVTVAAFWNTSVYFRTRIIGVQSEVKDWHEKDAITSSGLRLVFWKKAIQMIQEAPILGHGTGSIPLLYAAAAQGKTRADAELSSNPHNQTLTMGIQLGTVGIALLWSMWFWHFRQFRSPGHLGWIGVVLVVQNVIGSIFNSLLFDFTEAWIYIFGVGVATGMVFFERRFADGGPLPAHDDAVSLT
jgi:O-antigen ligase